MDEAAADMDDADMADALCSAAEDHAQEEEEQKATAAAEKAHVSAVQGANGHPQPAATPMVSQSRRLGWCLYIQYVY